MPPTMPITTTYRYSPLESKRHIRLLKILKSRSGSFPEDAKSRGYDDGILPKFDIVHVSVDGDTPYETVSYAWGDSARVGQLSVIGTMGKLGLTRSLVDALPRLVSKSRTRLLWIDQICINQDDVKEREEQVGLMGDVFKSSQKTLIWLGLDDWTGCLAKEFFDAINDPRLSHKQGRKETAMELKCLIKDVARYNDMASSIGCCSWLSRGWVVQEYLLSKEACFLWGEQPFSHIETARVLLLSESIFQGHQMTKCVTNFTMLHESKDEIISQKQSIDFYAWLRIMARVSGHFKTTLKSDGLYAYLGLWKPEEFHPSYAAPLNEQFTDLARCIAKETASLNFLAISSEEFEQLPTWVPVWTDMAGFIPESLVTVSDRRWNAANNRQHGYLAVEQTQLLRVQGRIVDRVIFLSDDQIHPYSKGLPTLLPFIQDTAHQYSQQWPGRKERLTAINVVEMLNECEPGGPEPTEPPQQILNVLEEGNLPLERFRGRFWADGRKIMASNSGRFGMVPFFCKVGDLIAIIHGCSVPLILSKAEDGATYEVKGDCFLQGCMNGEAVTWEEEEADEILLS